MRNLISLILVLLPFAVAAGGSALTVPEIPGWYASLPKSPLNPPAWVFGPVWTTLFALMAVAGALAYRKATSAPATGAFPRAVRLPLGIHAVQLVLNLGWSYFFFRLHNPGAALADLALLWVAILATLLLFWRLLPLAGALLVPYLAWVSFAAFLNGAVVRLS